MDALALTDRDGVYGAVRFAKACQDDGVRPVLGVDLAVALRSFVADGSGAGSDSRRLGGRPGPRRAAAPSSTRGCRGSRCSPPAGADGVPCAGW